MTEVMKNITQEELVEQSLITLVKENFQLDVQALISQPTKCKALILINSVEGNLHLLVSEKPNIETNKIIGDLKESILKSEKLDFIPLIDFIKSSCGDKKGLDDNIYMKNILSFIKEIKKTVLFSNMNKFSPEFVNKKELSQYIDRELSINSETGETKNNHIIKHYFRSDISGWFELEFILVDFVIKLIQDLVGKTTKKETTSIFIDQKDDIIEIIISTESLFANEDLITEGILITKELDGEYIYNKNTIKILVPHFEKTLPNKKG